MQIRVVWALAMFIPATVGAQTAKMITRMKIRCDCRFVGAISQTLEEDENNWMLLRFVR